MLVLISHQWTIHLRCLWTWMQLVKLDFLWFSFDFLEFSAVCLHKCIIIYYNDLLCIEGIGIGRHSACHNCSLGILGTVAATASLWMHVILRTCRTSSNGSHQALREGEPWLGNIKNRLPQILWLRFSTFSMTLCFFMSWSCFGSKCVAHAFADILFAEVKDESFNGDY